MLPRICLSAHLVLYRLSRRAADLFPDGERDRLGASDDHLQRVVNDVVYEDVAQTCYRTVTEQAFREVQYTVQKPVMETSYRTENYCVQKPVMETQYREHCYQVRRPVTQTVNRQVKRIVCKPVTENHTRQVCRTVYKQVQETINQERCYTVREPVTTYRTVRQVVGTWKTEQVYIPGPRIPRMTIDPCSGCPRWCLTQCPGYTSCRRVYCPQVCERQVPCTTYTCRVVKQNCPITVCRTVPQTVTENIPYTTTRMVQQEVCENIPVQVCTYVTENKTERILTRPAGWSPRT